MEDCHQRSTKLYSIQAMFSFRSALHCSRISDPDMTIVKLAFYNSHEGHFFFGT